MPDIELTGPDGNIYAFPEGTSRSTINAAMRRRFPVLEKAPLREDRNNPYPGMEARAPAADAVIPRSAASLRSETKAMSPLGSALQYADDVVRTALDGASFGFLDKVLPDTPKQRRQTLEARRRLGVVGDVADLMGSLGTVSGAARKGLTLAGRFGADAVKGAKGIAARAAIAAPEAAGWSALSAAGHGRDVSDEALLGAVLGGAGSAGIDALRRGAGSVVALYRKPTVTADQLRAAKNDAYDAVKKSGVRFSPKFSARLKAEIDKTLRDFSYHPAQQPALKPVLDEIDRLATVNPSPVIVNRYGVTLPATEAYPGFETGVSATLPEIDNLRRLAVNAYTPGSSSTNALRGKIMDVIDNSLGRIRRDDLAVERKVRGVRGVPDTRAGGVENVVYTEAGKDAGTPFSTRGISNAKIDDANSAMSQLRNARQVSKQLAKYDDAQRMANDALFQSEVNITGNLDRTTRSAANRLRRQLMPASSSNPTLRGYTPAEREALERVIKGIGVQNVAAQIGRASPQRNFLGAHAGLALGSSLTGNIGLPVAVMGAGFLSDKFANTVARRNMQTLQNIILNNGRALPATAAEQRIDATYTPLMRAIFAAQNAPGTPQGR